MSFLGIARPNDFLDDPVDPAAEPKIYERPFGSNFTVVVEGKPGPSRRPVGRSAFNYDPFDPSVRPDLQIIVSNPLGHNPTRRVCDNTPGQIGGVPASMSFGETQLISDAINDFACRFVNGSNEPVGRAAGEACTRLSDDGEQRFAGEGSTVQFCATIPVDFAFPPGETVVTVRLRDASGATGPPASVIVRVRQ
ncbi:MAG: hypothetical protein A3J75_04945 [Acidobacteria bacterium RBG_16_68_9]|nr:MAG: hypothetical protein A3J75_04945 [Acidobacteria bacterium RBG_16_68_9]